MNVQAHANACFARVARFVVACRWCPWIFCERCSVPLATLVLIGP